mmetsp:Transcript_568/g.964  ORF Transcript_568/g.964 Transcript_568/m.964 type:complete len:269 (-) Transcript_568:62-868(-)
MSIWRQFVKQEKERSKGSSVKEHDAPAANYVDESESSQCEEHSFNGIVKDVPSISAEIPDIRYYEDALSSEAEDKILEYVRISGLKPGVWKQLKTRRLQCWGGIPPSDTEDSCRDANGDNLPAWLQSLASEFVCDAFFDSDFPPNHVLINEYQPGEGIMHHTDGPLYLDKVVIISLGSPAVMSFRPRLKAEELGIAAADEVVNIILKPRSILFFSNEAYSCYMHGIVARPVDDCRALPNLLRANQSVGSEDEICRGVRTSLTIRHMFK